MRPSGGTGQPTKAPRRKPKLHKKANAPARARRPSVPKLQVEFNALRRELSEAREQQTATANVLKVISQSTAQLQPVLDTIVQTASRLCNAEIAFIFMLREKKLCVVATNNASNAFVQHAIDHPLPLGRGSCSGRSVLERQVIHIPDCLADREYTVLDYQTVGKYRSMLGVPLLSDGAPIGVITLLRTAVMPFTEKQIDLVKTFADQAVIAIENVRLFEAEQERTRELTESLQQQTATADVLKIISQSTFQLQPVFDAIAQTASRLCNAEFAMFSMFREGKLHLVASNNASDAFVKFNTEHPIPPGRGSLVGRTFVERNTVHIPDCLADPEYTVLDYQAVGRYRSMLGVPLLREGTPIGVIGLLRTVVMPFTERQIDLVKTFADQAVIAIENVRLFDEVQARTDELSEALRQQTATAEVLQVISRSAFDLQPVFDTVAESSVKLCDAERAMILRHDGELLRVVAGFNASREHKEWTGRNPIRPGRHSAAARAALERRTVHIPDVQVDPEYTYGAKDIDLLDGSDKQFAEYLI
jgi:GAF domain-containing protein